MKRSIAAALAAVTFASASPAFATGFILSLNSANPNNVNFGVVTQVSTPTYIEARLFNAYSGAQSFTDEFYFAVDTLNFVGGGYAGANNVNTFSFNSPAAISLYRYDLGGLAGDLFTAYVSGAEGYASQLANVEAWVTGGGAGSQELVATSSGTLDVQFIDGISLVPNYLYQIVLDGSTSSPGGSYTGNVTAAAVPEPATWAMMLAGFGAIGFAMRRRRQSHPKVRFAF